MHGASLQCIQATEMDFSPGMPSLSVTTRRRLTPQGTSCSFLQAVTQELHSIQRSASQINFIRAMVISLGLFYVADRRLGFLHHGHAVVTICRGRTPSLAPHERRCAFGIAFQQVLALPAAGKVERHERRIRADARRDQSLNT